MTQYLVNAATRQEGAIGIFESFLGIIEVDVPENTCLNYETVIKCLREQHGMETKAIFFTQGPKE